MRIAAHPVLAAIAELDQLEKDIEQASYAKAFTQPRFQLLLTRFGRVGNKLAVVGPSSKDKVSLDAPVHENLKAIASCLGRHVEDLVVVETAEKQLEILKSHAGDDVFSALQRYCEGN